MSIAELKGAGTSKVARVWPGLHPRGRISCRKQIAPREVKKLKGVQPPRMSSNGYSRHEDENTDGEELEDEEHELEVDEKVCLLRNMIRVRKTANTKLLVWMFQDKTKSTQAGNDGATINLVSSEDELATAKVKTFQTIC